MEQPFMLHLTHNVLVLFFTIISEAYVTMKGRCSGTFPIIFCTLFTIHTRYSRLRKLLLFRYY